MANDCIHDFYAFTVTKDSIPNDAPQFALCLPFYKEKLRRRFCGRRNWPHIKAASYGVRYAPHTGDAEVVCKLIDKHDFRHSFSIRCLPNIDILDDAESILLCTYRWLCNIPEEFPSINSYAIIIKDLCDTKGLPVLPSFHNRGLILKQPLAEYSSESVDSFFDKVAALIDIVGRNIKPIEFYYSDMQEKLYDERSFKTIVYGLKTYVSLGRWPQMTSSTSFALNTFYKEHGIYSIHAVYRIKGVWDIYFTLGFDSCRKQIPEAVYGAHYPKFSVTLSMVPDKGLSAYTIVMLEECFADFLKSSSPDFWTPHYVGEKKIIRLSMKNLFYKDARPVYEKLLDDFIPALESFEFHIPESAHRPGPEDFLFINRLSASERKSYISMAEQQILEVNNLFKKKGYFMCSDPYYTL